MGEAPLRAERPFPQSFTQQSARRGASHIHLATLRWGMKQKLTLTNRVHLALKSQPIRIGVPWPQGAVSGRGALVALDSNGKRLPLATRVLNCWPDGSVQWSLLDLALDFGPSENRLVTIEPNDGLAQSAAPVNTVIVLRKGGNITLTNGSTSLSFSEGPGDSLVDDWPVGMLDVLLTDASGTTMSAARSDAKIVRVEEANPLRSTIRIEGRHQAKDQRTLLDFWIRFTLFADRPQVRITYHYQNLEKQEPGIDLRSMVMELRTSLPASAQRSIVHVNRGRNFRMEPYRLSEDFEICSSNTMDLANYAETHKGITGGGAGRVFIRQPELLRDDPMQKPWFLRNVVDFKFQSKDMPEAYTWSHIGLVSDQGSLVVAGGNMVGLHPKSLAVAGNVVRYSIWPEWAGTMDITQGEGRTLDFFVATLPPNATDVQIINQFLSWELSGLYAHWGAQGPVAIALDIEHVRRCGVFQVDKLPAYAPRERFAFERKVQAQWAPDGAIPANGHWHYGDVFYRWDIGANNEEMAGHQWFQEYLRTGRANCLERGLAQAQHIADVDICAYSADPYQNGGMCSHGPRHNHTAAYPSHMWFTELLFAYAFTGDEEFKKAAVRVCDNLVFWVNDKTGLETICADGRESGQPLINLSWTYQFAPDRRYLDAMWKIVRESFMARVKQHGSLVYMKPREEFALIKFPSYGEWAAWEGMFYLWELTKDEELRKFMLSQFEWRLTEEKMGTHGIFRDTDYNVAAYAYYLTGDKKWLDRVARPFRTVFRGVNWPFGYIKTMFFLKLAFEHGIVKDEDVLIS